MAFAPTPVRAPAVAHQTRADIVCQTECATSRARRLAPDAPSTRPDFPPPAQASRARRHRPRKSIRRNRPPAHPAALAFDRPGALHQNLAPCASAISRDPSSAAVRHHDDVIREQKRRNTRRCAASLWMTTRALRRKEARGHQSGPSRSAHHRRLQRVLEQTRDDRQARRRPRHGRNRAGDVHASAKAASAGLFLPSGVMPTQLTPTLDHHRASLIQSPLMNSGLPVAAIRMST